jgi:hypothetical protein
LKKSKICNEHALGSCKAVLIFLKFYQSGGLLQTAATKPINNFTNGTISNARLIIEEFSMQLIEQNLNGNIVRLTYNA